MNKKQGLECLRAVRRCIDRLDVDALDRRRLYGDVGLARWLLTAKFKTIGERHLAASEAIHWIARDVPVQYEFVSIAARAAATGQLSEWIDAVEQVRETFGREMICSVYGPGAIVL